MKTYSAKPSDVTRVWYHIDADGVVIGRLATQIANLLTGKTKPQYTAHIDTGDYVVVTNAAHLAATGKKPDQKLYRHYSGYPSGLKESPLREKMQKNPAAVLEHAVYGMLPANKLRDERMKRLKIYPGSEHQHTAQKPQTIPAKEKK
jgi:large subunit ribosomal protein L13